MKPETPLKAAILDALAAMGVVAWNSPSGQARVRRGRVHMAPKGTPDIVGYLDGGGRMLAIEVKVPGEEPKPHQAAWMDRARRAGVVVACAHSVAEAVAVVDAARRPARGAA